MDLVVVVVIFPSKGRVRETKGGRWGRTTSRIVSHADRRSLYAAEGLKQPRYLQSQAADSVLLIAPYNREGTQGSRQSDKGTIHRLQNNDISYYQSF
jgi:hypothetical protein